MKKLLLLAAIALVSAACSKKVDEISDTKFHPTQADPVPLKIEDVVVGTGREAHLGDTVKVLYTGTLMNGQKFDSTHDRNDEPAEFKLEEGGLIKGWIEGMKGMKVGGKRKLTIPPDLGYGAAGHPPDIPPESVLKFEIELVGVS